MRGIRTVWGGRSRVRTTLYMATLCATRYNPAIRESYGRLVASGKPKKVVLTACMRKLLTILAADAQEPDPLAAAVASGLGGGTAKRAERSPKRSKRVGKTARSDLT